MKVTIFVPVSRSDFLDRFFAALELLDCDTDQTSLLAYVDGDRTLFEQVANLVEHSKFNDPRCIKRPFEPPTNALHRRRKRIAAIKNESKALIGDCDYVFGLEDDTIIPSHALMQLLDDYAAHPHAGFIEGVELGRWGIPYVGAWRADDVYEPTRIESAMPGEGTETIDAGGFYCYITKREHYTMAEYKPFAYNDMGPDVAYGLYLRQQGYQNYIDWRVSCEHRQRGGQGISLGNTEPRQVAMVKESDAWKQKLP